MWKYNTIIVLLGTGLLGTSAGLVGTFAVLRRRALIGDAVAHSALPGLCLAFIVVGARDLPAMLTGALITGVLGVAIVAGLRNRTRIKEDAAIGIVLSVFFGAGVVLSSIIQRTETGAQAGLDSYILGKTAGMLAQDVYLIGGVALVNLVVLLLLYKEFRLVAFDTEFARIGGWPTYLLDLLLMVLIALTVVIGLPAVGVVMMTALLILPAAAARFWTERLDVMMGLAALLGATAGVTGTAISANVTIGAPPNAAALPAGPSIVLSGVCLFLFSVIFGTSRGVIVRLSGSADLTEPSMVRVPN